MFLICYVISDYILDWEIFMEMVLRYFGFCGWLVMVVIGVLFLFVVGVIFFGEVGFIEGL